MGWQNKSKIPQITVNRRGALLNRRAHRMLSKDGAVFIAICRDAEGELTLEPLYLDKQTVDVVRITGNSNARNGSGMMRMGVGVQRVPGKTGGAAKAALLQVGKWRLEWDEHIGVAKVKSGVGTGTNKDKDKDKGGQAR